MNPGASTAQLLDLLASFEALLDLESERLLGEDADLIAATAAEKERLYAELEHSASALDSLASEHPEHGAEVRATLQRCAERNLANGRLIARLRGSAAKELALLTGRSTDPLAYAAGGVTRHASTSRSLARV
ncbi:MAG: hypothetical protein V2J24_00905 [Pseudomonadales bacterium]|jgi:flagellar biosynthesis/type III secretory pathway chaperone|nr:hypothetical protein [Pseudomonadales bacterium]